MQGEGLRSPRTAAAAPGTVGACASYHALLEADPDLSRRTHDALLSAHNQHGLMIQGRPLCNVLRPRFITQSENESLAAISATMAGVLERAGEVILGSDALLDLVGASDAEREIWSVDPGYSGLTVTSRLDAFVCDGQPRFIEYNAESPAGIGFCDRLTEVFESLPAIRAWDYEVPPQPADGREQLRTVILGAYREWGGIGTPTIAVVDWDDVITRRDFELCAEHFRNRGLVTVICDPRSLTYREGALWLGNERIDLIYRRVLLHELLEKAGEAAGLLQAYRDGAVCMVNSPRSKLLHKKALIARLEEGALPIDVAPEEQAILDATLPWTRYMEEGTTTYAGESVDLLRFVLAQKERFALKPSDDYGGHGVVLGWETAYAEWERALETSLPGRYVVQERVDVPSEAFPALSDGTLSITPLLMDTDPLMFKGKLGSILTRLSGSALLNVTAGTGSTTPTFVLAEER